MTPLANVLHEIKEERRRQIVEEDWSLEHDDNHVKGELAMAASCYALSNCTNFWPWAKERWKPKSRRHDLIRAAALIIAEVERLDRQDATGRGRLTREQANAIWE